MKCSHTQTLELNQQLSINQMFRSIIATCAIATFSQAVQLKSSMAPAPAPVPEPETDFEKMFAPFYPNGLPDDSKNMNFAPKAAFDVVMSKPKFSMVMLNTSGEGM